MKTKSLVIVGLGSLLVVGTARAGGIFVPGTAPQAQARAGAFVAKADDPSAVFHNPAGFAKGTGTVIQVGANFLDYDLKFTRAGGYESPVVDDGGTNPYPTVEDDSSPALGFGGFQAIPIIAVTTDLGLDVKGLRFGAGLFAPNGFPEREFGDYDFEDPGRNPPPNRYDVQKQDVTAAFPSIGASYTLGKDVLGSAGELDIGARFSWGFAGLNAESYVWAVRNYDENIATDGFVNLDVKDNFIPTFGLGVLYRPLPVVEIGLAYNSQATIAAKGESFAALGSGLPALGGVQEELLPVPDNQANCEPGGEIGALKSCVTIKLPQTLAVGGRYVFRDPDGSERGDIELDVKWENWSAASDYRVVIDGQSSILGVRLREAILGHGLKDVLSVRLGGAYSFPVGPGKIIVRAGAAYDTATADDEWTRLDIDSAARTTLAGGLAWQGSSYRVEAGGGYVIEPDRTTPVCNPDVDNPDCANFSPNSVSPSPTQPLQGPNNQVISPFNGGDYSSSYRILSLGVTTWF
ncbi:MAG: outer membrane protein transport protein [Deltaproteobacteria bacterium]|nr:outer membrane protein transport protein [Deltaproteobacteria bacterium]